MIFDRTVLIERIKAEIERRQAEASERTKESAAEYEQGLAAYLDSSAAAWNDFANTIKRRLRAGAPVTSKDIPAALGGKNIYRTGGYLRTWNEGGPLVHAADVTALTTLLHLLESSTSSAVSTAELERMGFKMAQLFRSR